MSDTPLTFTAVEAGSTVQLTKTGEPTVSGLQYRTSTSDAWSSYTIDTVITLTNVGDYVQFQNTLATLSLGTYTYCRFVLSGKLAATGDLMSMLNYTDTVPDWGFRRLFQSDVDNPALVSAPELSATTIGEYACSSLFERCTGLIEPITEIPALTLGAHCFDSMYVRSGVTTTSRLAASVMAEECCILMYYACTNLQTAEVNATTLALQCFRRMFYSCASLNRIYTNMTTWAENATLEWLSGVSSSGNFYKPNALPETRGVSYIPTNWTLKSEYKPLTLTANTAGSTVQLTKTGSPTVSGLQYRRATSDSWSSYTIGSVITLTNVGDYVQFQNTENTLSTATGAYVQLVSQSGSFLCSGSIQALVNYSTVAPSYSFAYLFRGFPTVNTPEMPATVVNSYAYSSTYRECSLLLTSEDLPASEVGNYAYGNMYRDSGLQQAPAISATSYGTGSLAAIFTGCTSLTTAPDLLAKSVSNSCLLQSFSGCSTLSKITVNFASWGTGDPTTNWVSGVASSGIFYKPLALPEEYGPSRIPSGWQVINTDEIECSTGLPTDIDPLGVTVEEQLPLTLTAVEDSTVTLNAVGSPTTSGLKFRTQNNASWSTYTPGTTIQLPAGKSVQFWNAETTLGRAASSYVRFDLGGTLAASGDVISMINFSDVATSHCFRALFQSCSNLITPPEIGLKTLDNYCCAVMLYGCSMITKAPVLSAKNLASGCYSMMYRGCETLSRIEVDFDDWVDGTSDWVRSVAASGTFIKPAALPEEYGPNRIPEGWTVINKD